MSEALPIIRKEDDRPSVQGTREPRQWRTARRVCSSAGSQEAYKKMIADVRMQFLTPTVGPLATKLPGISVPNPPSSSPVSRLSRSLRSAVRDRATVEKHEEGDVYSPSLLVLEQSGREHIIEDEAWERQVLKQMMVVHYVTFVLREELNELEIAERDGRGILTFEEERERHWLQNESETCQLLNACKAALLAKEEKKKRLQENEALYRMRSMGDAESYCRTTREEPDAERILQEYMKLKGMSDDNLLSSPPPERNTYSKSKWVNPITAQRTSPPVVRVQPLSNICDALGIAAYMDLLDKHSQGRRMLVEREEEDYKIIMMHFEEQASLLLTWQHKRMHLERLMYWRAQNEERRRKHRLAVEAEVLKPGKHAASQEMELTVQETEFRDMITTEEAFHRAELWEIRNRRVLHIREGVIVSGLERGLLSIVNEEFEERQELLQDMENSGRCLILKAWEREVAELVPAYVKALSTLDKIWKKYPKEVVAVQSAFRRFKAGRLGWRRTHREVGSIIRERRDKAKIDRGRRILQEFKAELAAEYAAVECELHKIREVNFEDLFNREYNQRLVLYTEEEWRISGIRRAHYKGLNEAYFAPRLEGFVTEEVDGRRCIDVEEEFVRTKLLEAFDRCVRLVKAKQHVQVREERRREAIKKDEEFFFLEISSQEMDGREFIRILILNHVAQQAAERESLINRLLVAREAEEMYMYVKFTKLHWNFKRIKLEMEAEDPAPRAQFAKDCTASLLNCFVEGALSFLDSYQGCLIREHSRTVCMCRVGVMVEHEEEARHLICLSERRIFPEITSQAYQEQSTKLRRLVRKVKAAECIKQFYKKYKKGLVGRSGRCKYLREAFAVMKEKAELEEISVQQRSDIHRCRESLQRAVAMDAYFKHRRLALELDVLETKAEPRERAELEAQQEMIFNFLVHSRSSTNTPAVDKFTTLRQEESYGRVKIRGEWQKGFENIYYPKKKQFVEEVMAVIVQRRWRRLLMQKHQRIMLEARMNEMVQLEALNRGALEVSEITERFVQIVKPMEGTLFLRTYLKHDVSRFLHEMCFRISFEEGIQEEEWRNRMLLLWRMRNNYKENVIEVEERTERAKMQRIEFYGGIDKVEIIDDETALRTTLCNERLFFLLRMLIKMERAIRQEVQRTCFISFLDVAEQHSRKALHMEHINSLKESIKTRYIERSSANFKKHQIDGFSEDDDKSQPCDSNNSGSLQESSEALIDSDTPIENTGNSSTNVVQTNDIPETTENEHLNRESEPASISTSTTEEQHAESVDKNKQPHSNCQDNNRSQETLKINPPPTTSEDGMAEDQQEKQAPEEGVAEDQQEKQAPEEGVAEDQQEKQAPEEGVAEDQQEKQAPEEGVAEDQQKQAPEEGVAEDQQEKQAPEEGVVEDQQEKQAPEEGVVEDQQEKQAPEEGVAEDQQEKQAPEEGVAEDQQEKQAPEEGVAEDQQEKQAPEEGVAEDQQEKQAPEEGVAEDQQEKQAPEEGVAEDQQEKQAPEEGVAEDQQKQAPEEGVADDQQEKQAPEEGVAEDQQEKQAPEEGVADDQQEKQAPEEGVADDQQEKQAPEEGVAEDQQEKQAPEEGVAEDQQEKQAPEEGVAEDQQKQAPEEGVAEDQQEKQAPEEGVAEDQQEKQAPEEGVAEDQQEKQAPEEGVAEDQQKQAPEEGVADDQQEKQAPEEGVADDQQEKQAPEEGVADDQQEKQAPEEGVAEDQQEKQAPEEGVAEDQQEKQAPEEGVADDQQEKQAPEEGVAEDQQEKQAPEEGVAEDQQEKQAPEEGVVAG